MVQVIEGGHQSDRKAKGIGSREAAVFLIIATEAVNSAMPSIPNMVPGVGEDFLRKVLVSGDERYFVRQLEESPVPEQWGQIALKTLVFYAYVPSGMNSELPQKILGRLRQSAEEAQPDAVTPDEVNEWIDSAVIVGMGHCVNCLRFAFVGEPAKSRLTACGIHECAAEAQRVLIDKGKGHAASVMSGVLGNFTRELRELRK